MTIFLHELKAYRKSTLIWTVSMIGLMCLFLSMYPSIAKDAAAYKKILEGFPLAVRKALGLKLDSMTSILGFYSYLFLYVTLCGCIQAVYLGLSILSKEIREKTADFLLTKPVTREHILTAKLSACFVLLLVTNFLYLICASFMVTHVASKGFNGLIFFMVSITLFFVQIIFLTMGLVISVIISKLKSVLSLSLIIVFVFFIIGMFSTASGEELLRYFTPFQFYSPSEIIAHSHYEIRFIIEGLILIISAMVISFVVYRKKDIHAV